MIADAGESKMSKADALNEVSKTYKNDAPAWLKDRIGKDLKKPAKSSEPSIPYLLAQIEALKSRVQELENK